MHRPLSCLLAIVLGPLPASALDLSIDTLGSRVRSHHPALKAARIAIDEARGRQLGAGRLSNPTLSLEFQGESHLSPRSTMLAVDQAFPVTRRLAIEKGLSAEFVTMAELEVQDAERRFVAEARSLAIKLLAIDQQHALRRQQMSLAEELSEFAKGRAAAGELSPLDAGQAQLDAHHLLLDARRLETERVRVQGELKPLLGLRPADPLKITGALPPLAAPKAALVLRQRADYQMAQSKVIAADTSVGLARARRWQDVTAGLFAAHESQDAETSPREHSGFVGFRVSIPLPVWDGNEGEIAEKAAGAVRARAEAEALSATIRNEAEMARQEMRANAALVEETREKLLPLVIEQTGKLEKAYEQGQADLLTVLRAREQRLQLEAAVLDATRDFHLARIRYEAALGVGSGPGRGK